MKKEFNLKPFNLKEAKTGKSVCTRDGKKVRIICFDVKESIHPIVALIKDGERERLCLYMLNGRRYENEEWEDDLMMLPEKKEGWINVYKGGLLDTKSYPTKKEAFDKASLNDYVDTVKITWEE